MHHRVLRETRRRGIYRVPLRFRRPYAYPDRSMIVADIIGMDCEPGIVNIYVIGELIGIGKLRRYAAAEGVDGIRT